MSSKIEILKKYKREILSLALAGTIAISTTGCSKFKNEDELLSSSEYSWVGDEFTAYNGESYRFVKTENSGSNGSGLINNETFEYAIKPYTYDDIGKEFISANGRSYRFVKDNTNMPTYGLIDTTNEPYKTIIPSNKYSSIGEEFEIGDGELYRKVKSISIYDKNYSMGWIRVRDGKLVIKPGKYKTVKISNNGEYIIGIKPNGKVDQLIRIPKEKQKVYRYK